MVLQYNMLCFTTNDFTTRRKAFLILINSLSAAFVSLNALTTTRNNNTMMLSKMMKTKQPPIIRILLNGGDNMLGRSIQLTFPIQSPGEEQICDSIPSIRYVDLALNHPSFSSSLLGTKTITCHDDGQQQQQQQQGSSSGLNSPHLPDLKEIRKLNKKGGSYLWGAYQQIQIEPKPDLRLMNIETAITKTINNDDVPMWKGIRYHAHVDNFYNMIQGLLSANYHDGGGDKNKEPQPCSPLVLCLSNNHIMDYGRRAMEDETLPALKDIIEKHNHHRHPNNNPLISTIGCGMNFHEASKPARISITHNNNKNINAEVEVFAVATECSGTAPSWGSNNNRSGIIFLPFLDGPQTVKEAIEITKLAIQEHSDVSLMEKKKSTTATTSSSSSTKFRILSVHFGPNWALKHETDQQIQSRQDYCHRLIDECDIDLIYGHSSHHMRGMEIYHNKLILYGTGDIINDYEGFENPGEETYNTLGGIYLVDLDVDTGNFHRLSIIPTYMDRLRLERYTTSSYLWRPNEGLLEPSPNKGIDLVKSLNRLSEIDAGGMKNALQMEYVESDPHIPGGPILVSKE